MSPTSILPQYYVIIMSSMMSWSGPEVQTLGTDRKCVTDVILPLQHSPVSPKLLSPSGIGDSQVPLLSFNHGLIRYKSKLGRFGFLPSRVSMIRPSSLHPPATSISPSLRSWLLSLAPLN